MKKHHLSLVVLAGGLGTRFGGNKQIAEIAGLGCTIMELSIADAVAAGVTQVVLVINQAVRSEIEQVILPRLPTGIDVVLVEQHIDLVPEQFQLLAQQRSKPWGTGHALLCAKDHVHNPAIVITADDYYGASSFLLLAEHFKNLTSWAMVGYPIIDTLSDQGGVNRGVCQVKNNQLIDVVEYLNIQHENGQIMGDNPQGLREKIAVDALASMSFWAITPTFFDRLEAGFDEFLQKYDNGVRMEYYLPDQVQQAITSNQQIVTIYTAKESWYGVTYKSELQDVTGKLYELRHG
ncbi:MULTISPECIES: NTP transferase domain-containing protein [unclassified Pseudoalteromonas]|uniref:NTP transferase domain-containing protein n=1 Tax=unclassified Pseudoalteromonas TaxID=194690 RepID=UPI0016018475|nr:MULTISPECIES: NTP transferase domain-containing protein [unclassified Pseudoalteromonas]MBB1399677.1 NTP transferase domain-containing protein [Pseudoalteromonas sp. SG44-8]MBB1411551.1 NTP transferase domain-containing protein [Pseudoalteromonas sp. SG44-17]MBB1508007.1 NTP transferase domain-containing protein [Pseudoalteromonas sp. SG41-1]